MNSFDAITLKAFLAALSQIDTHLPREPQEIKLYRIHDIVGEICITPDDGRKVYDLIYPEILAGVPVELDFTGVDIIAPPFLNFAIGQLLKDIKLEDLTHLLKVSNLIPLGNRIMQRVIDNAKEYYSDEKIRRAVEEVLMAQSLSF